MAPAQRHRRYSRKGGPSYDVRLGWEKRVPCPLKGKEYCWNIGARRRGLFVVESSAEMI